VQVATPRRGPPPVANRLTDVEIPKSAWSAWREEGKPRQLRRALTSDERQALEVRRDELAPMVAPFMLHESNHVGIAVADMFGSYRSMRQTGEEAMAVLDATVRVLAEFPRWAIEKACRSIQMNGVWRNGAFDRQWPPNDSELVKEVREKLRLYGDAHRSAVALLEAEVEEDDRP
jgi:hypothetical protein